MIITCPNCNKQFKIDNSLIQDEGRDLQCGSCNHVWFYKIEEINNEVLELNEEIISGSPSFVYDQITKKARLKGETVLVISNNYQSHYTNEMILDLIKKDYSKFSTKELALYISNKTGLPKKSIYNRIIELKS